MAINFSSIYSFSPKIMSRILVFISMFLLVVDRSIGECSSRNQIISNIGVVINYNSRTGREGKISMELALSDFNAKNCSKLAFHFMDSFGSSARAISYAMDLIDNNKVEAIMGTLTFQEAALISEFKMTTMANIPIISLTSPAISPPNPSPFFIQIGDDITTQFQCLAAIVSHFKWQKMTIIHELNYAYFSDSTFLTILSDSLRGFNIEIEHHSTFQKSDIEENLNKLRKMSNRVFVILQSSLEFANILFEKAKQMGMMEKGYVWIVSDEIGSFIDTIDSSIMSNMEGVIGFKTNFVKSKKSFRQFKFKFRTKFRSEYHNEEEEEEDHPNPSVYALRAYDATYAIAKAINGNISSSDFEGLSGRIRFKDGKLVQSIRYEIINVVGKGYRKMGYWSQELGSVGLMDVVFWPGGGQEVPKGWAEEDGEKALRIGVPAKGAFNQFVRVWHDGDLNGTYISGFSVDVFEAVVKLLPYKLSYVLEPFYGSYDEMVEQVYYKGLDAAVGDTEIMADRYKYAEFSQPYVESGLIMVVPAKPEKSNTWMLMKIFTGEMWLLLAGMHLFIGLVIWLTEHGDNPDFHGLSSVLWFSVTVLFFVQREPVKTTLGRVVLAPWLFMILVVTASFTAALTSRMTVSTLQPSVVDVETLKRNNAAVGCNGNSFIVRYLVNVIGIKPKNIRHIGSITDYPEAFASENIAAAFFVTPHARVFLAKYCKRYIMAGPTYKLGGFGFVFQKGSPLALDISVSILKLTENGEIENLENDMLSSFNCMSTNIIDKQRLGPGPFSGLFFISGGISVLAFFIAIMRLVGKNVKIWSTIQEILISRGIWKWVCNFLATRYWKFQYHCRNMKRIHDVADDSINLEMVRFDS